MSLIPLTVVSSRYCGDSHTYCLTVVFSILPGIPSLAIKGSEIFCWAYNGVATITIIANSRVVRMRFIVLCFNVIIRRCLVHNGPLCLIYANIYNNIKNSVLLYFFIKQLFILTEVILANIVFTDCRAGLFRLFGEGEENPRNSRR